METRHQVHNLIILDESGSMETIKDMIISGFNEIVQTVQSLAVQFPEQEHYISFVSFNGTGIKELLYRQPVAALKFIDKDKYLPSASTPLYDAMGFAISKLRNDLYNTSPHNVLVTILTDGEENSSTEYDRKTIKHLIEDLKQKNWTFTYIGTEHDVESSAVNISISNTITFEKNENGIRDMLEKEKKARYRYNDKIRKNESVSEDYYKE